MSSSNQIGYQWKPTTNKIIQQKKKDFSKINAVDETGISLCIRFAFKNITPNKVFAVMKNPTIVYENGDKARGSFGFIDRIDYIIRRDGNKTYFVHFRPNSWNYNNTTAVDALNDMKEGKNAGCGLVIGVLSGEHSVKELKKAGADIVVNDIMDLDDDIHSLNGFFL